VSFLTDRTGHSAPWRIIELYSSTERPWSATAFFIASFCLLGHVLFCWPAAAAAIFWLIALPDAGHPPDSGRRRGVQLLVRNGRRW